MHEIRAGGWRVAGRKSRSALIHLGRLLRLSPALPPVLLIRLLRPIVVVRIQPFISENIGHLAGNPEIFLSETEAGINVPPGPFVDICYFEHTVFANRQLETMWRRVLRIWP